MIAAAIQNNEPLPNHVDSHDQLKQLPDDCLSGDPKRPLLFIDSYSGSTYKYALQPLFYSVGFILIIEILDTFSYYGIVNTETQYLQGEYSPSWNANMTSVQAASYVSAGTAIAYSVPFLAGIIADGFLGEYFTILFGTCIFYIPGLLIIALTTIPYLLGQTFNESALKAGILVLYPLGDGFIKSVVNVFGAKQYHPLLQSDKIQTYYVNFYQSIQVGAIAGCLLIPLLSQKNLTAAYMLPVTGLTLGVIIFLLGTKRYVRATPRKDTVSKTLKVIRTAAVCKPVEKSKQSNGGDVEDAFVNGIKQLLAVIPACSLTIPFNIVFAQMITVFSEQGMAMRSVGLLDASMMINFDSFTVLIVGVFVSNFLYPYLSRQKIHLAITHKFAIGTFFATLAIVASIIIEYCIHRHGQQQQQISILWQIFIYIFVGAGEIFARAAAYEASFVIAPPEQKGFASAINLFFLGGVPNYISIALYNACSAWFPKGNGAASTSSTYVDSKVYNYLWVLFGITMFGVLLNVYPPVKNWVESIHQKSCEQQQQQHRQQQRTVQTLSRGADSKMEFA
jgi:dipeptide/tripeptide permease